MSGVPRHQAVWNTLAMIGFIALFVAAFYYVSQEWGVGRITQLGFLDIILIGLAAQRLTRLATNDKIFAFVREWFFDEGSEGPVKPDGGIRRLIAELIECVWCTSMWAALVALFLFLIGPIGEFAIMLLAISSLAMIGYNLSLCLARVGNGK